MKVRKRMCITNGELILFFHPVLSQQNFTIYGGRFENELPLPTLDVVP